MLKEHAFVATIEELDELIVTFQKKVIKKKKVNAKTLEQFKAFKALRKTLVRVLEAQLSADQFLDEDDWRTLLESTKLTTRVKDAITKLLDANKAYPNPKEFVQMVEQFYSHRYTNHEKYLGKLDLGIDIDIDKYQAFLEQAIEYTLKQKGTTAKGTDLSANLILLLRGRLKENEKTEGVTEIEVVGNSEGLIQFNLSLDSENIPLTKITNKLNEIPLIKKWDFKIKETYLTISVVGVASYQNNRVAQLELAKVNEDFSLAMDVLTGDISRSLTNSNFTSAVAASDTKIIVDLGDYGTAEFGVKLIDFAATLGTGVEIVPVQAYGKLIISFEKHKKLFEKYQALTELTTLRIDIVANVTTTLGVDLAKVAKDKILKELDKTIKATELIADQEIDYLKNQETFNDLMDRKTPIDQLEKKNKALGKLIAKEKNPAKKKKLLQLKGKQNIELIKRHQAFNKALEKDGIKDLATLKEQVKNQKKKVDKLFKEALKQTEELQEKLAKPAYKLMAELLQKQTSKRLLSLMMKAVPGLNIISCAMDIYDAYTLVQDISAAYMDADTEMEIDANLAEQIANAAVDLNEISEIVITFFTGIGAGGRLTELKPHEVEGLTVFFEKNFPKGDECAELMDFIDNYAIYYENEDGKVPNLVSSIEKYYETQPQNLTSGTVEELKGKFVQTGSGAMFKHCTYKVAINDAITLGHQYHIKALGMDKKEGKSKQIPFEFDLLVMEDLGDNTYLLQLEKDLEFEVVGFKTYQLRKEARFIYNENKTKLTLE